METQSMHPKRVPVLGRAAALTVAALLGAVGCSTEGFDSSWPEARPLGRDIAPYRPAAEPAEPAADALKVDEPTGTLTLRQALTLALARSPELAAASWEVRAAEARAIQAGLWPNPEVRLRMGDFGGTGELEGVDESDQSIRLSQVIEIGGKAAKRRQVARSAAALGGWDYEATRLTVFRETTKAYVDALVAQERLAAAQEMHDEAKQAVSSITKRVAAGTALEKDAKEAQMALGMARIDLDQARRATESARGALADHWEADQPKFQQVAGDLEGLALAEPLPLEQLLDRIPQNPQVARWQTDAQMRQADIELQRANGVPDLRVLVAGHRVENTRDHGYMVAVEFEVPIFDRNQGAKREARFNQIKAAWERKAAISAVTAELRDAHRALADSYRAVIVLRDVVLPAARSALEIARKAFLGGADSEISVLKAHRDVFRARDRLVDALGAYHQAVADIEHLIARPISDLGAPMSSRTAGPPLSDAAATTAPSPPE